MTSSWLTTTLSVFTALLLLRSQALGSTVGLGKDPSPPASQSPSTGTLTLTYSWVWGTGAPGSVEISGTVPTSQAVVTGVQQVGVGSSDITIQQITLSRGDSLPVPLYPNYGYTGMFNGFPVFGRQWLAVVTVLSVDSSSTLTMVVNISWSVPNSPPPPPPPKPQPLQLNCSSNDVTLFGAAGEHYFNDCSTTGGLGGNIVWKVLSLPPGLSDQVTPAQIYGVPKSGNYIYSVSVSDSAGEVRTRAFQLIVPAPKLAGNSNGVPAAIDFLLQQ